ncbi:GIY-YIG nuclease family protein [Corynebacterium choanae]|uniref:Uncharacterized protein n=1 Tax=Corynebacterium choanae TaxID=1862358 RepID=A0A3G6J8A5_9CORY|nr:GIY-YIG nuclease family protein [Corynebacterium choanae]AZA14341.1 hypothetical protein CCHOA_09790 [Corynebacterium choanae]
MSSARPVEPAASMITSVCVATTSRISLRGNNPVANQVYRRWQISPGQSIAPFIRSERRGIYVLEFSNGDRCVGQSVDVVTRFATHVHGSSHHEPWGDIVAFAFRPIPSGDLNEAERFEISRLRKAGYTLRNKAGNLGHGQPAPFDAVVSIEAQHHWATGAPNYELHSVERRVAAGQPLCADQATVSINPQDGNPVNTKLGDYFAKPSHRQGIWQGVYEAIFDDLGFLLHHVIPNAVDTELDYWTLSDMPSTARGRFATLNTGVLEIAFFPRQPFVPADPRLLEADATAPSFWVHVNFPEHSLLPVFAEKYDLDNVLLHDGEEMYFRCYYPTDPRVASPHWVVGRHSYRVATRDMLSLPVGSLEKFVTVQFPGLLPLLRQAAITMMRQGPSGIFRRFHSPALATQVFSSVAAAKPTAFGASRFSKHC